MPVRFRRQIRVSPGLLANLNKNSISMTLGWRGMRVTIGPKTRRITAGIAGTGLSYTVHDRKNLRLSLIFGIIIITAFALLF